MTGRRLTLFSLLLAAATICGMSTTLRADDGGPALRPSSFDYPAPVPGSYNLPPIKPAPDGTVLNLKGREISLRSLMAGRIALLSFFYGSCDDAHGCPLAIATLMSVFQAANEDPQLPRRLMIISQSFDPGRDTPAAMAKLRTELLDGPHTGHHGASGPGGGTDSPSVPWEFLSARSEASISPLLQAYGQALTRGSGNDAEKIAHLLRVYLIDSNGMIRNIYGVAYMNPDVLLADIRTLLLEERAAGHPVN